MTLNKELSLGRENNLAGYERTEDQLVTGRMTWNKTGASEREREKERERG